MKEIRRKRKTEVKKVIAIAIDPRMLHALRRLSEYSNVSLSKAIRSLLPDSAAIDSMMAYQNFQFRNMPKKQVLKLFGRVHRDSVERIMSEHPIYPIGLQTRSVAFFDDKNGSDTFGLFKKFTRALSGKKGYRFDNIDIKKPKFDCYVCLGPGDDVDSVGKQIVRYFSASPDSESIEQIQKANNERKRSDEMVKVFKESLRLVYSDQIKQEVGKMFDEALAEIAAKKRRSGRIKR